MARPFPAVRGQPKHAYDVVVIGAGIGGLTTAALLARAGLRVLVVEQHYMVGGYCSTFRRDGYIFDAATHFYPLLGNANTISGRLLRQIGVSTRWIKMDPVDHFHLPDGTRFTVPADFAAYRAQLDAMFPDEAGALREFFGVVRSAYVHGLIRYFRWREPAAPCPFANATVRDVLDRLFRDERLKLLLTADCAHWGSAPGRTSFVFDSMLRLSYFLGNYYPQGGSQAFADALASCVTSHGGEILMSTKVARIVVHRGVTGGVELLAPPVRSPRRITVRAPVVVSNADLLQTAETMLGPEEVGTAAIAALRRLRPTFPCYLMHIGLRDMPTEVLREHQGYYWDGWDPDRVGVDALRFKIFVPTLYEPAMAPPNGHVVIVQKVQQLDDRSMIDWQAHKHQVDRFIVAQLEKTIPGIGAHTVVRLSATALTHNRYTLNYQGAMLGWEMSPDQLGAGRPDVTFGIAGFYTVGHWTRPGGGITPVLVSAVEVARRIVGGDVDGRDTAIRAVREPGEAVPG